MEKTKMFTLAGRIVGNLFKKPATTQYPFEPVEFPERMRGHISIRIEDCITCGLCARACPSLAIQVDRKAGPSAGLTAYSAEAACWSARRNA